jgi:hypothetical protein
MTQPSCLPPRLTGMRRYWKPKSMALAAIVTMSVVAAGVTGCGPSEPHELQVTTAAPPTVVCGTVLNDSASGAVLYDATRHLPTIKYISVGGLLFFRVARGCDQGTHVHWLPSSAAHLIKAAYAKNGQTAAVVLEPSKPRAAFRLIATQNGRVVASATVKFASYDPSRIVKRRMAVAMTGDGHPG